MAKKLTSRKFILSALSLISGVAIALSEVGGKVGIIAGVIIAFAPAATYIITEGVIDAKAVGLTVSAVSTVSEAVETLRSDEQEGEKNE